MGPAGSYRAGVEDSFRRGAQFVSRHSQDHWARPWARSGPSCALRSAPAASLGSPPSRPSASLSTVASLPAPAVPRWPLNPPRWPRPTLLRRAPGSFALLLVLLLPAVSVIQPPDPPPTPF